MRVKEGVTLDGLRDVILTALPLIESVYDSLDLVMVVVGSIDDDPPRKNPAHREGRAVDLRAHQVNPFLIPYLARLIQEKLGPAYRVVYVLAWPDFLRTHIHVEWVG